MKTLEFTEPFGNFNPGDVIEVEDDAVFDSTYLREAPNAKAKARPAEPDLTEGKPLHKKRDA